MLLRLASAPLVALACIAGPLTGQVTQADGPSPQAGASTIRVTSRIVVLDVVVADARNKVVRRDFTRDDFTITEDGTPQAIRSFDPPAEHRMPRSPVALVNSAADLKKIGNAPVTIMVLDELNGRFEDMAFARQKMVNYLQAQPAVLRQPTVLLIATNTKFVQVHDYTQNRDELVEIIHKHMPEYPWRLMNTGRSGSGAVERMGQVLASLQQIAQASSGSSGRKNIIWVGNGFPSANLIGLEAHQADTIQAAFRRITAELLAAHAIVYTINPTMTASSTVDVAGPDDLGVSVNENGGEPFGAGNVDFSSLAPFTGGASFTGRNDLNNVIAEAIDSGQEYYTLSYVPTNRSDDDAAKFRKIKVVMKDPSLHAYTRDGYYQFNPADLNPVIINKETSVKQVARTLSLDLSQALTSTMSYNGLDVTAERGSAGAWTLHVKGSGIGWSDGDADGAQHEEATIGAAWYDAKGKIMGHVFHEEVAPRPLDTNTPDAFPLQITLPPGVARIRFVVRDASNGHMGTSDVTAF